MTNENYCTIEEVDSLFTDISDQVPTELMNIAIQNSKSWINSKLILNKLPITYDNDILKTVAIYFSASDIIEALYNGDEYQERFDYYFNKANQLLEEYIESSKVENNTDSNVNHRNAPTYKESVHHGYRTRCYY